MEETPAEFEKSQESITQKFSPEAIVDDSLIKMVDKIIFDGIEQRASDILLEPQENELRVRFRIDGLLYKHTDIPKIIQENVITRLKIISGLDISEHRLPQDGRFKLKIRNAEVDFRVSVIPSTFGEKVALRVLDSSRVILDIDGLGFDKRTVELLKRNLVKPFGMILVCGPTGSGKTTTLYSALKYIDSIEKNIITVEDPVEYQLFGINQVAVCEDIGLTFASALRSILRQDPDIILVGEIRDFETGDIAVKAALTGHLLLSTLHTTSAPASLVRLANMGVEPFLIASSCLLIVSQVLARKLCVECKEKYHLDKSSLEKLKHLNLPIEEGMVFYRKKGCDFCNNIGYRGRIAIGESMEITPAIRDLIIASASEKEIRDAAIKEGMKTLRENAFNLLKEGITDLDEVLRVTVI
ncbi:MAG: GspE/PulE family protein [Candidatus Omnitrophica bacterium]|nr:GspE/PulE family protein [Candidatus Omnitrophota bacterium]